MNSSTLSPQAPFYARVFLLLLLVATFTRGLFILALPKSVGMLLQLMLILGSFSALFYLVKPSIERATIPFLKLGLSFIIVMLISGGMTSYFQDFHHWIIYIVFNAMLVFMAYACLCFTQANTLFSCLPKYFACVGWTLFLVALAEQLHLFALPGTTFFWVLHRPASLTGSFLHYPIAMSLLSFFMFQSYHQTRSKKFLFSGCVFWLAPLLALSRSGMIICIIGFGIYLIHGLWYLKGHVLGILAVFTLFFGALGMAQFQKDETLMKSFGKRIFTAASHKSSGNRIRIGLWKNAVKTWLGTHLLLGEYAGMVTNTTKAVNASSVHTTESGFLQLLLNFGLIGCLLFYTLLFYLFSHISPDHIFLRAGYIAALIQTCVYQSVEVLPFMILILLLPVYSKALEQEATA